MANIDPSNGFVWFEQAKDNGFSQFEPNIEVIFICSHFPFDWNYHRLAFTDAHAFE